MVARTRIIDLSNSLNTSRVLANIQNRQGGKCHNCRLVISNKETIVSIGSHRIYYHKTCAMKLNIIWHDISIDQYHYLRPAKEDTIIQTQNWSSFLVY